MYGTVSPPANKTTILASFASQNWKRAADKIKSTRQSFPARQQNDHTRQFCPAKLEAGGRQNKIYTIQFFRPPKNTHTRQICPAKLGAGGRQNKICTIAFFRSPIIDTTRQLCPAKLEAGGRQNKIYTIAFFRPPIIDTYRQLCPAKLEAGGRQNKIYTIACFSARRKPTILARFVPQNRKRAADKTKSVR